MSQGIPTLSMKDLRPNDGLDINPYVPSSPFNNDNIRKMKKVEPLVDLTFLLENFYN